MRELTQLIAQQSKPDMIVSGVEDGRRPLWHRANQQRRARLGSADRRGVSLHCPFRTMQKGYFESLNRRMRDELLNETLFMGLAQVRVEMRGWRATTGKGLTHPVDKQPRQRSPPNWTGDGLLRYALRAPLRSLSLQPRCCAKQPPACNPSRGKAEGHVKDKPACSRCYFFF